MQRIICGLLSLAISAGLGIVGVKSYRGAQAWVGYMTMTEAGDPASALVWNMKAYEAFPLEPAYRRQISGALTMVLAKYQRQAQVDPAAADMIAKAARTVGPDDTSVLLPRAEYLLNFGRWQEPEMAEVMGRLARIGARTQSYWLLLAYYETFRGDLPAAQAAIDTGLAIRPVTIPASKFLGLRAELEKTG